MVWPQVSGWLIVEMYFFLILANDKSQNKIRRAPACERNVSSAYLLLCMSYTEGGEITFGFLALRKF